MNYTPEQARELVAQALESGEFIQTQGSLYDPVLDAHCCLGVAMRVYMTHENNSIVTSPQDERPTLFTSGSEGSDARLLTEVRDWLGFSNCDGKYADNSLTRNNDYNGMTFSEIAKLFRNPPKGLLA